MSIRSRVFLATLLVVLTCTVLVVVVVTWRAFSFERDQRETARITLASEALASDVAEAGAAATFHAAAKDKALAQCAMAGEPADSCDLPTLDDVRLQRADEIGVYAACERGEARRTVVRMRPSRSAEEVLAAVSRHAVDGGGGCAKVLVAQLQRSE